MLIYGDCNMTMVSLFFYNQLKELGLVDDDQPEIEEFETSTVFTTETNDEDCDEDCDEE